MFGKKKKKASQGFENPDEISQLNELASIGGESDLTADYVPGMTEEDFDSMGFNTDDPLIPGMSDGSSQSQNQSKKKEKSGGSFGKGLAILLTIVVGVAGLYMYSSKSDNGSETPSTDQTNSQNAESPEGGERGSGNGNATTDMGEAKDTGVNLNGIVVNEEVGKSYTGSELGNPQNGTGAIMSFDYYYYVERDGDKAMQFFNPNVKGYNGPFVQTNINKVPQGTKYKLEITPVNIGKEYDVILTLSIPGRNQVSYRQSFETMNIDGRYYVKNFTTKGEIGEGDGR